MNSNPTYPNADIERASIDVAYPRARIAAVVPESPADDAGFTPGCIITAVDGQPVRDVIDWRWLTADDEITLSYIDTDGDEGDVELWREWGEEWGFEFDGLVFDGVKQCRNACTFCFMHQLPRGMRPSLSLRDDDFRLSFLVGTFVTLTNITPEDEARIIEQHISPLRVSLQMSNDEVRRKTIGKHAPHGIEVLDRLLEAGIEFHAQIVLVPDCNDGEVLVETLQWAYARPGILNIGIVPLGYTRHQTRFDHSFNEPAASRGVLDIIAPFQQSALTERQTPWVFAADEFYSNAWGESLLEHLPPTEHYGDFSLFEDGIGIIRSTVDDWEEAERECLISACITALRKHGIVAYMVAGYAQKEFLSPLVNRSGIGDVFRPLYVKNDFFGGNVDVTGLLVGADIANAISQVSATLDCTKSPVSDSAAGCSRDSDTQVGEDERAGARATSRVTAARDGAELPVSDSAAGCGRDSDTQVGEDKRTGNSAPSRADKIYLIPSVIFNDDHVTLDDMTLEDMEKAAGQSLHMVSCSPIDYFREITALL